MLKPRNVKDILTSPEFLAQRERSARYVHHEFQDYAYRLASDLGDLSHKPIYMRLARKENRLLLEQAAAFAMGYFNQVNKGKVFMWKLQQLKSEQQRKKDMQNHEHDFVMTKMSQIRHDLSDVFAAKQRVLFNQDRERLLTAFAGRSLVAHAGRAAPKIWQVACGIGNDLRYLNALGFKIYAMDGASALVKKAKQICPDALITRKPLPLENNFKEGMFVGVISSLWPAIPLDKEEDYLREFHAKLAPNGSLVLEVNLGDADTQSWQEFDWQKDIHIRFEKINHEQQLQSRLQKLGWNFLESVHLEKQHFMWLLQKV